MPHLCLTQTEAFVVSGSPRSPSHSYMLLPAIPERRSRWQGDVNAALIFLQEQGYASFPRERVVKLGALHTMSDAFYSTVKDNDRHKSAVEFSLASSLAHEIREKGAWKITESDRSGEIYG